MATLTAIGCIIARLFHRALRSNTQYYALNLLLLLSMIGNKQTTSTQKVPSWLQYEGSRWLIWDTSLNCFLFLNTPSDSVRSLKIWTLSINSHKRQRQHSRFHKTISQSRFSSLESTSQDWLRYVAPDNDWARTSSNLILNLYRTAVLRDGINFTFYDVS